MRMSPLESNGNNLAMVWSTAPAGTISQTARGLASFLMKSASEAAPAAFSFSKSFDGLG